jgi:carbonic anhydrase/acetyltransferase-like protein (isoleucine patch superfamily)
MSHQKIVILGASYPDTLTLIEETNAGHIIGYLDDALFESRTHGPDGFPLLGHISSLGRFVAPDTVFVNNVFGNVSSRFVIAAQLAMAAAPVLGLISPHAQLAAKDRIRLAQVKGIHIQGGAFIGRNAALGEFCAVRPNATVGHDVVVGKFTFIGPNSTIGGRTRIGAGCFIGMGARIFPGVVVASGVTVAANAVVTQSIELQVPLSHSMDVNARDTFAAVYVGAPARLDSNLRARSRAFPPEVQSALAITSGGPSLQLQSTDADIVRAATVDWRTPNALAAIRRIGELFGFVRVTNFVDPAVVRAARDAVFANYNKVPLVDDVGRGKRHLMRTFCRRVVREAALNGSSALMPREYVALYSPLHGGDDIYGLRDVLLGMARLRNNLFGVDDMRFNRAQPDDDMYTCSRLHLYPAGGGCMDGHTDGFTSFAKWQQIGDRLNSVYWQVLLPVSIHGVDFSSGGGFIKVGDRLLDWEPHVELGDVVVYGGNIFHGVHPVDSHKQCDVSKPVGRIVAMVTVYVDFDARERQSEQ